MLNALSTEISAHLQQFNFTSPNTYLYSKFTSEPSSFPTPLKILFTKASLVLGLKKQRQMPYEIQLSKVSELNMHFIWYELIVCIVLKIYKSNVSLHNKVIPIIFKLKKKNLHLGWFASKVLEKIATAYKAK